MYLTSEQINRILTTEKQEAQEWGLNINEIQEYLFVVKCEIQHWNKTKYDRWLQASLPA